MTYPIRFASSAAAIAMAFVLTACGAGGDLPPPEGERISVLASQKPLAAETAADRVTLRLPAQQPAADWPQRGAVPSHAPGHLHLSDTVRKSWTEDIGAGTGKEHALLNPPVVSDGRVFAMTTKGEVVALDVKDGDELWDTSLKLEEDEHLGDAGGLGVANGKVYATTGAGEIFALNAETGEQVWQANVGVPVRAAPTLARGKVYVVSHNNRLFALDGATGSLVWTHSGIEEQLALLGGASPAVAGELIVVPYSSGEIYVLNADNGVYMWHDALSLNVGADVYASLVDVLAMPVVDNGQIFAVNHNGRLSAFSLNNGDRLWSRELSATQTPWVVGNVVYVVTEGGQLAALNRVNGAVRWVVTLANLLPEKRRNDLQFWSGPILAGGRLLVVSNTGYAFALSPTDGTLQKEVRLPEGVSLPPVVAQGALYFMTDDAEIVAFQ